MKRGSSGATFTFLGDRVVKRHDDNDRVMQQGDWLKKHGPRPSLPTVYQVYAKQYVMEQLQLAPAWSLNHGGVFNEMLHSLHTDIWSQPAEVKFNPVRHGLKVSPLAEEYMARHVTQLDRLFNSVQWSELPACLTHGDPTFDNVMFREDTLVIIDPIPATPAVPDLRCVDYGKILTSCMGFEQVRYARPDMRFHVSPTALKAHIHDDNEWAATVLWGVVHWLRFMPYAPDAETRERAKTRMHDTLNLC